MILQDLTPLKLLFAFMCGLILVLPGNAVSIEKKIRDVIKSGILPIIDVEYHHGEKIEIERHKKDG